MKAQRRHELQENELAKVIKGAPTFWQQSGGKVLLGLIVVLVVIILIRYRISANQEGMTQAREQLATARALIDEMQQLAVMSQFGPPQQIDMQRKQFYNDASNAISEAMQASDDRRMEAEALIARGDLNWIAATMPELPGAATQPSLKFRDPKELTATASEAYEAVLNSYSDLPHARITARFGLAAIAENRGDFDAARAHYEKVAVEAKELQPYQTVAAQRLALLPQLRQPVRFGTPATLAATTGPAAPTGLAPTTFVAAPQPTTLQAATATAPAPAPPATTPAATTPTSPSATTPAATTPAAPAAATVPAATTPAAPAGVPTPAATTPAAPAAAPIPAATTPAAPAPPAQP